MNKSLCSLATSNLPLWICTHTQRFHHTRLCWMKNHNLFLIYLTNDAQGIYGAFIGVSRVKTKELLQKAGVGGESKASTLKGFFFFFYINFTDWEESCSCTLQVLGSLHYLEPWRKCPWARPCRDVFKCVLLFKVLTGNVPMNTSPISQSAGMCIFLI